MNIAEQVAIPLVRDKVSETEWQSRVNLAAAYRLVALCGWDDLAYTHISARVPGAHHHFLINPYGMLFEEITASSLVKVDINGNIMMETAYPISPAGFVIHSAIHAAREDAKCVLHLHSNNGIAVSAQQSGLLPISQHSALVLCSAMSRRQLRVRSGGDARIGYAALMLRSTLEVDRALPSAVLSTHRSR